MSSRTSKVKSNTPADESGQKKQGVPSHADIARAAGVSAGLVSAFFSGKHYSPTRKSGIGISEATRRKIKKTCIKLNYVPESPLGFYRLYPEKADVAFMLNADITDGIANPYHSLVADGFSRAAIEAGVDLSNFVFHPHHDYLISPDHLPNAILRGFIKKVAITGSPFNYSLINQLLNMDVVVVAAGQAPPIDGVLSVVPDFQEAARLAIHTLHEFGHRKIAVFSQKRYERPDAYNGRRFHEGCRQGFAELGISMWRDDFIISDEKEKSDEEWAQHIAESEDRPTAIFMFEDQTARVLGEALTRRGVRIPEDISIMGCNDDFINQQLRPGYSTIHLPCRRVGSRSLEELNRIAVEGRPASPTTITIPVHFVDNGTIRKI